MSLQDRVARMDALLDGLDGWERPHPLVAMRYPPWSALWRLITDTSRYLERRVSPLDSSPNGNLSPGPTDTLAYNGFVKSVADIVGQTGLDDRIDSWCVPFYPRRKRQERPPENLSQAYPSELPHVDTWAGELPAGVRISIVLEGDFLHNRVDLFAPPDDFDESWLAPLPSYAAGQEIAARYAQLKLKQRIRWIVLADMCIVHQTVRDHGCGDRLSLDASFLPKGAPATRLGDTLSPSQQEKGRMTHEELRRCGIDWLFVFDENRKWRKVSLR